LSQGGGCERLCFSSGVEAREPETGKFAKGPAKQTLLIWRKIKERLEEMGSSLENIVKITKYVLDVSSYLHVAKNVEAEFFRANCPELVKSPPASTLVQVSRLAREEMLIEVEVIALTK